MSLFKSSPESVERELSNVDAADRPKARLVLDLADVFGGPTYLAAARRLAALACDKDPRALALALREAADRYLAASEEAKPHEVYVKGNCVGDFPDFASALEEAVLTAVNRNETATVVEVESTKETYVRVKRRSVADAVPESAGQALATAVVAAYRVLAAPLSYLELGVKDDGVNYEVSVVREGS